MAERYHRAQILLQPEQYKALAETARRQGRSISDVTREILGLGLVYLQSQKQQTVKALERLSRLRAQIRQSRGEYPGDPLAEARLERAGQIMPPPPALP